VSTRPGGSSIGHESSTSKISAAAGISEYLLKGLDVSTPEEALEKLLSGDSLNTNSEGISAPEEENKELQLEQEVWEARFKDEFLQRDVLDIVDRDPRAYFVLKALLRQLQNTRTSEALLFLVNQAEHIWTNLLRINCYSSLLMKLIMHRFRLMLLYGLTLIKATLRLPI
jgi:hypothetical protein